MRGDVIIANERKRRDCIYLILFYFKLWGGDAGVPQLPQQNDGEQPGENNEEVGVDHQEDGDPPPDQNLEEEDNDVQPRIPVQDHFHLEAEPVVVPEHHYQADNVNNRCVRVGNFIITIRLE